MNQGGFYFDLRNDGEETKEIVIRHGEALPLKEPEVVSINGTIDSLRLFLEKRRALINELESHVLVNRESLWMKLIIDEKSAYSGNVYGKLEQSKVYKSFNINTGKEFTPKELANFFRMNRAYFQSIPDAMKLIDQLMNFEGKVNKTIEAKGDNVGNRRDLREQAVTTNLPAEFTLVMPIFKGMKAEVFSVEIFISPDDLRCQLVSPEAEETMIKVSDEIIDAELIGIVELCPELAIISI